ncbi:MAG TPA: WecB/TagA/CpsF family glycosyltransferase [Pirellulaceae bacterium]|nr:WecB/TagA/CpsF family glycosyltransferase [Pirellulaceae bacterium]
MMNIVNSPVVTWPKKFDVLGVQVSATDYDEAVSAIIGAAQASCSSVVSLHAVHPVVVASGDAKLRAKVNTFEMVGPDGQPVRWALNLLYRTGLKDRVYGPELMIRICERAAACGLPIYLYGSTEAVLRELQINLTQRIPDLVIAGVESPPFRELTAEEAEEVVQRIRASGAAIVFIGLGAPKQDEFAYALRGRLALPLVCVGAAFDFHAGTKRMAPRWMQRRGLEWLFRLVQEPRRLWRRYFITNSLFLFKLMLTVLRRRVLRVSTQPISTTGETT